MPLVVSIGQHEAGEGERGQSEEDVAEALEELRGRRRGRRLRGKRLAAAGVARGRRSGVTRGGWVLDVCHAFCGIETISLNFLLGIKLNLSVNQLFSLKNIKGLPKCGGLFCVDHDLDLRPEFSPRRSLYQSRLLLGKFLRYPSEFRFYNTSFHFQS